MECASVSAGRTGGCSAPHGPETASQRAQASLIAVRASPSATTAPWPIFSDEVGTARRYLSSTRPSACTCKCRRAQSRRRPASRLRRPHERRSEDVERRALRGRRAPLEDVTFALEQRGRVVDSVVEHSRGERFNDGDDTPDRVDIQSVIHARGLRHVRCTTCGLRGLNPRLTSCDDAPRDSLLVCRAQVRSPAGGAGLRQPGVSG